MKKYLATIAAASLVLGLSACGGAQEQPANDSNQAEQSPVAEQPVKEQAQTIDLVGSWSAESAVAEITKDKITIQILSEDGTEKFLYWVGDYKLPETLEKEFTFTSNADKEALSTSIMGSQDDTKEFTYKNGKISFEFQAMGMTKTIEMQKK